jgi:2-phospho-L-lactate/phosphoenolpyruvate guanylyltransferase
MRSRPDGHQGGRCMITALVPAKALDQAKGRLAELLSEHERRSLSLVMLADVLRALNSARGVDRTFVVSPDQDILRDAERFGADPISQPHSLSGINEALKHSLKVISLEEPTALLVLLADVPAVTSDEIESILSALPRDVGAVICPSRAEGTSALALRPPDVVDFRFGPNSLAQHEQEASARGVPLQVMRFDSLLNDVDEPDDLRYLLSHAAETATHRLLAEMRVAERLGG